MSCRPLLFFAAFVAALGSQMAVAQPTVFIGGQGLSGVTINLSAIFDDPAAASAAPALSLQPDLAGRLGVRRLQIPNLHLTPPVPHFTLRQPGPAPTRPLASASASTRVRAVKAPPAVAPLPSPPVRMPVVALPKVKRKGLARAPAPPAVPVRVVPAKEAPAKPARLAPPPPPPQVMPAWKAPSTAVTPPPPPPPPSVAMGKVEKSAEITTSAAAPRAVEPAKAKRQRLAALTPSGDNFGQVRFRAGSSALTRDDEDRLKAMADKVAPTEARLRLEAYAKGTGADASKARRLSLSRALAVRSFLIENGLRSTRIDVRALGIARDGDVPDRVDIVLLGR
jgi:outer membrane protein OmpA-like peptidoglycan-associated protein